MLPDTINIINEILKFAATFWESLIFWEMTISALLFVIMLILLQIVFYLHDIAAEIHDVALAVAARNNIRSRR